MILLLAYFIGLQIGLQFLAAFFTFKIARLAVTRITKLRVPASLVTIALLILAMRRVQALLSVKLIFVNFNKILAPISLDTIVVQTIVSLLFAIGFGYVYKYLKKIEPWN